MNATPTCDQLLELTATIRKGLTLEKTQDNPALVRCLMNGGGFTLSWSEMCYLLEYVQKHCDVEFLEKPLNAWNAPGKNGTITARPVRMEYDYRIKQDAQVFSMGYEKK